MEGDFAFHANPYPSNIESFYEFSHKNDTANQGNQINAIRWQRKWKKETIQHPQQVAHYCYK
jgi:hypothetical protein